MTELGSIPPYLPGEWRDFFCPCISKYEISAKNKRRKKRDKLARESIKIYKFNTPINYLYWNIFKFIILDTYKKVKK